MDNSEQFSQLHNEDNTKVFRVATEWGDQCFKISVLNNSFAWFATVTKEHINKLAEQHEIDSTSYFANVKKFICHDQTNVSFDVKDKQFILYRTALTEKLRLKYFVINLEKISYESTVELFIDTLVAKYKEALSVVEKIQTEKIEAITQELLLEKQCEEFAELKRKSDLQMYSAFTLVLNEKKQRIRFLTELLECPNKQKKQVCGKNENEQVSVSEYFNGRKREVLSDSESNKSGGYNTDDEKQTAITKLECVPSTSKSNFDFLGGDSPPPLLPKRIKMDQSETLDVVKIVPSKDTQKDEPMILENNDAPDDEDFNFNTQELLDRM
ncbi:hypothetical protein RI129_002504 [Pyrocoelia pectoralis]|uniref:XRCC4 N-terminal domain-containing protein n=1 Tax=Pyrocoelia pectoralis TaxID=417401 RepID=A0AAN7ZLG0_9COLE